MNLHLMTDDKFLDWFIENFSKYSPIEKNLYLVYNVNSLSDIKIIKNKDKIFVSKLGTVEFKDFISNVITKINNLFVHSFSSTLDEFIIELPINIKIYWLFWSGDFYSRISMIRQEHLYSNEELKFLLRSKYYFRSILSYYYSYKYKIRKGNYNAAIKRVNYFLHWNKLDYEIVKEYFDLKAEYISFFYGNLDNSEIFIKNSNPNYIKKILLGSSGSAANNLLEALKLLQDKFSLTNVEIICPLAYGSPDYIKKVISVGYEYFGNRFKPLTSLLPLEDYYKLVSSTSIGFMNNVRSQGAWNVITLLKNGKKIFMNKNNSQYKMLKEMEAIIFNTAEFTELMADEIVQPLKKNEVLTNINVFNELFSDQIAQKYLVNIAKLAS